MLRPYLSADRGMLFLFDIESEQSFWMRNTLIPLDIIYINSDGVIVSIANGLPLDTTPCPQMVHRNMFLRSTQARRADWALVLAIAWNGIECRNDR